VWFVGTRTSAGVGSDAIEIGKQAQPVNTNPKFGPVQSKDY
jgi:hypothetical protein